MVLYTPCTRGEELNKQKIYVIKDDLCSRRLPCRVPAVLLPAWPAQSRGICWSPVQSGRRYTWTLVICRYIASDNLDCLYIFMSFYLTIVPFLHDKPRLSLLFMPSLPPVFTHDPLTFCLPVNRNVVSFLPTCISFYVVLALQSSYLAWSSC